MNRKAGLLMLAFAVLAMTGCSSNSTDTSGTGLTADQVDVQLSLAAAPEVATDGSYDTGSPSDFSVSPEGAPRLSGIEGEGSPETNPTELSSTRRWWRSISGRTASFDYEFTAHDSSGRPTAAHITLHKHFTGTFHVVTPEILTSSTGADSVVLHHTEKPLADHWVRHLWLQRVSRALNHGRAWRLVAASGVNVTSEIEGPGTQPEIQSIRVQVGESDSTFSDPAAAIQWHKLWRATHGSTVTVTVTTNAPDDVVVLMHHENRHTLTPGDGNTYTGTWTSSGARGLKHFGVNALSNGTISDAGAAYHSNAWLFPYLNRGEAYGELAGD